MPRSSTSRATTAGLRARLAAVGAVVAAEVGEVDGLVDVGVPAAAAVLGVRRVLELRQRERVVLDAEVQGAAAAAEVGDERVVGVEHERASGRRARATSSAQRSAIDVELAVAVELVAEQVGRAGARAARAPRRPGRARTRRPRTGRGRRRARGRRGARRRPARWPRRRPCWRRRGCARAGCRRARAPPRPSRPWSSCRWWPRSRRCRATAGAASRSIACGSTRVSTLPGQRGAAAAAGRAGEAADGAGGGEAGGEPHHGASTRSVPGTTSTVAGSSAIGSPSA